MSIGDLVSWFWFDENKRIGIIVDKLQDPMLGTMYVVMWGNGQTESMVAGNLIPNNRQEDESR